MNQKIKVVAFDADDTLWVNEPHFQAAEHRFAGLLEDFLPHHSIGSALLKNEIKNLPLYGYGAKGFMLSMIETAIEVSDGKITASEIEKIIRIGHELLEKPIELLPGVTEVLEKLRGHFRLVVATKGDLLDQERKLKKSGLEPFFHHVEIMSEKDEAGYAKLLRHLDIAADEFLMIGNSLKSDVLPVLKIGGWAAHVPFHTTWALEKVEHRVEGERFFELERADEILPILLG